MRRETPRHDMQTWAGVGAVFGLAGGILAVLLGSLLTAAAWLPGMEPHSLLHALATALLVATIPLLALGACCLDKLEAKTPRATGCRSARRAPYRSKTAHKKNGLKQYAQI